MNARRRRRQHRLGSRCSPACRASAAGLAENIVAHRDANGPFRSRRALKDVPRLGAKAFEQCAGFLRIPGGDDPLDASAVHPEAYPVVRRILTDDRRRAERAHRQHRCAARAPAGRVRRRHLRPADRHRHPHGAGEARAATRGRRSRRRPSRRAWRSSSDLKPGMTARGRGHQRRRVRRVRRHRRPPGRAGARVGDVAQRSSRTRARW